MFDMHEAGDTFIFESPDNGHTVYARRFGDYSTRKSITKGKSFKTHMIECTANGTLVKEPCPHCSNLLLTCKKYGGNCKSSKCREERIIKED